MDRRQFFTSVSVVGFTSLAGCISSGSDTSVPTDDPEAVAKAYYNAMWSGDPGTMEKLVHSESKAAGETDMRDREIDREVIGVKTVGKYNDITIVELNTTDKYVTGLRVTLRKEDGDWKVVDGCPEDNPDLCSVK